MNKKAIIFSLATIFMANVASAQFTEQQLDMQRLQDRLDNMEKNMSTMQQEVYRGGGKKSKKSEPQPEMQLGESEEVRRDINGRMEEMDHKIMVLTEKLDKIITDIDFRISNLEKKIEAQAAQNSLPVSNINTAKPEESAIKPNSDNFLAKPAEEKSQAGNAEVKADASTQYEKAFGFLRQAKYAEAETEFKDFIKNNKDSDLLGNAYYWLGETYYIRENYQQAAVNFLKGYQDYPKGNKAADNLLKLSLSLKSLKKEKEACATLDKLKNEYPKAEKEIVTKADGERKAMKCK